MLGSLFEPRTVAVVGASDDTTKLRGRLLELLIKAGFKGEIYPVNPSSSVIQGLDAYPSLSEMPLVPDVALIAVPGQAVPGVIGEAVTLGVKGAVVYSSGVDPIAVRAAIGSSGMEVLGSNTEGFYFAHNGFAATFAPALKAYIDERGEGPDRPGGKVSIVSQSGGMGFATFGRLAREFVDIHSIITTGNEDVTGCLDALEYLVEEQRSRVIVLFIEGLKEASRFGPIADRAREKGIAIVVLKVGASGAGQRAALSHTAHLAGSDTAYDAVIARHGAIRVFDQEQLLAIVPALARLPRSSGRRLAIVTTSGGAGTWAADQCEGQGLRVPELSQDLQTKLAKLLPPFASLGNPIDVTGQAVEDGGAALLEVVRELTVSGEIDAVLVNMGLGSPDRIVALRDKLRDLISGSDKPILFHSHIPPAEASFSVLAEIGGVGVRSLRGGAAALDALAGIAAFKPVTAATPDRPPVLAGGARVLGEGELSLLFEAYNIPVPRSRLATSRVDAEAAASEIGGQIALKIQSSDIQHKTEAGGVVLGLAPEEVGTAFDAMMTSVRRQMPDAIIDGILVQQMVPQGAEMIVGIHDDIDFGPMLMLGAGGIYAEVLRDTVFAPAPINRAEALRMIESLRSSAIIDGARGQEPLDKDALAELLVSVGEMAVVECDQIRQLDLNPVIVLPRGEGVVAVDALVVAGGKADAIADDQVHKKTTG